MRFLPTTLVALSGIKVEEELIVCAGNVGFGAQADGV